MSEGKPPPRVKDAELTADGGLFLRFNRAVVPGKRAVYFTPEALFAIGAAYGEIPAEGFNDFPGDLVVTEEAVFAEDGEEDGEEELEPGDGDDIVDAEILEPDQPGGTDGTK
jgi:hypothetical protein